ncbi:MAG: class I SAM-dependent methyltransferase [Candidatus Latescibacteria bacterium]|nr:class I SAM-dependent methyltransferase [Candidatus Latescibacterota bacterium]
MNNWYMACNRASLIIGGKIPEVYRSRTFSGILGDIKALSPKKALSLINRKKGLGLQYAYLYLTCGIDNGRGDQTCAAEALTYLLKKKRNNIVRGNVLDVGCAVGVAAGVLGIEKIIGFDLFYDLLYTARIVDSFSGANHSYITADMTKTWPFERCFDTVLCGLVCHHLKEQPDLITFFSEANRVLKPGGSLVITLPSGTVSTLPQMSKLVEALETFGFLVDQNLSGMALSTDSSLSLFWMFVIIARKESDNAADVFIDPDFGFHVYRTPVSREEKGVHARETAARQRLVKHEAFTLMSIEELNEKIPEKVLIFENVCELMPVSKNPE